MIRVSLLTLMCVFVAGCVTNTQSTQNAQLVAAGIASAPARVPAQNSAARNPSPVLTPAARLANAKLITVSKTTASGALLMLASPQSLAPDCSSLGRVEAKVLAQPDHGVVTITNGTAFSNFTPGDAPYLCNARRSPATVISYRSEAGYAGQDTASVQIFFPDGRAPEMLFHIEVR